MINQYQKSLLLIFLLFSTILLGKNKKILIEAQDDTYTITYSTESQLVGSVYDNDRYSTATPTDKEVHFSYVRRSTDNNGKYISTAQGGMLRLPAGLAEGRHYVYYKIRDIKDATHFATATATVIVLPQTTTPTTETPTTSTATTTPTTTTLTAQDDTYTVTYSTEPQLVGSVYDNDHYGTQTPTDKEVHFSYVRRSTDNNGKYISTTRGGMLQLPAGLAVGHHYVYYKIRDIKDVTNFATATATVIVLPQTTTPTTETPTISTATTTHTTSTLTAQDDTYTVTYSTEPQTVGSVYDNDRYGTATPTDKEVQFSYVRRSTDDNGKFISTAQGGMLHLPAGLSVGRHYVYYKIRDIKDATHSASATATVIVLPQTTTPTTETPTTSTSTTTPTTTTSTTITLTAQDDTYTVTYSTDPQTVGSVYDNDHYGTATPTDKEVQFSYVHRSTDNNGKYISTASGGMLRLPAGLSVGRHYVYYKIRDIKDITHFATATATVIVLPQTTTPTTETPTTSTATTTPTTTTLTAQDDTYTVTYSTDPQTIGSVYDNDRYGTATPTDKEVQFSYVRRSTDNNGKFISTAQGGMLRLPAGLAEGRHYVYYKIRDIKDATHFATATATVIVLPQTTTPTTSTSTTTPTTTTLSAQDDTYTVTYSTDPQMVGSVYDNDRYGTTTPTDKEVHFSYVRRSTDDNGKYISTIRGGMLRLPAGLAVGRHYVYYKIRDIKDVTHFATATATVIVLPQTTTPTTSTSTTTTSTTTATTTPTTTTLTAQDDTYTVTYSTESQIVGSVYDNDHYGTATPTDREVQFSYIRRSTDDNGKYISTTRGGMLQLPAGLAVGRHYVYYKIRDIKDITHFATATATVIVLPKTTTPTTTTATTTTATTTSTTIILTAQDDTYTVTYSTDPKTIGSVYDNDHYGTATPTDKEVQFSYVRRSTDNNGKYISTTRGGMLQLPVGLSVGRHYVYYKIIDIKDATHFATATATVIVLPQTTTPTTETPTTSTSTTTSATITLTAQDDTYTVTYSTDPQIVGSVYDNDHYGTATPTDKEVQFSYVRRSTDDNGKYISTIRGGMLRLPAGLSVGRHYVYYKIRDIKDITHFATATATVIVLPQTTTPTTETPTTSTSTTTTSTTTATTTSTTITLTAQNDTYTVTYSNEPQTVGSVYDNDHYGTQTPTDKEVQFSYVRRSTDDNGKYISTARGGMLHLPSGLAVGHHYVYYKIRDIKDVTHFATATATVIVLPQTTTPTTETPTTSTATTTPTTTTSTTITLTAQNDTYTVTYSNEPQIVGSVCDNDHYGTATPTDKEVQFSYVRRSTDNNGKYISTIRGGMLRLPAGLSVGRHYVYYKIRDIKDVTHFATATATVIVLPQTTTPTTETPTTSTATTTPTTTTSTTITLTAQDDTYTVTYSTESQLVGSVYDNDHYGTQTPTDKDVQFSYVRRSTDNNGKFISTIRGGMLSLPAGLAVGRHYVYYKIRDIKDATHSATATATVIVLLQTTTPTTETPTTSTATTTPTTTTSTTITLTAQDDTYTVTYSAESQLVGSVYDNDHYGTATPTDKEVHFSYVRRSTDNNGKYISTTRGGMLRLPAALSVGHHYVYYKIRDIKDITHFATATATVIVLPQTTTPTTETPTTSTATTTPTTTTLTAQDDTYTVTYSIDPQLVGSVYDNDRYGTATPTDKEVLFLKLSSSVDNNGKYISTVQGGMLRLPAGLSVGRHYVYYKIRDIKDATHFATATATVIVLPKTTTPTTSTATTASSTTITNTTITLTAQDDTYTVTYSTEPQMVGSVYDNDRYGSATPTDKEVQFSYVRRSTDNNGKYISTTQGGMLHLPAGLSVGRHYVYYKIRDIKDVTHFATATATVIVLLQTTTPTTETPTTSTATTTPTTTTSTTITLTAQDDTYTVTYSADPQTIGSVYDNDRYGTATPTDKEVQFSYVRRSTDDNGKYISTTRGGMLRLPAGLSVGHHYVYYKIRDIKDATHFATATATVIVLPQTTTPTTETPTTSTSTTTNTTITLTAQDDTYTVTYSTESQLVGSVYDNDRYGTATPTDKEVQFSYVRRSTDDNGKYISTAQGGMLRLPAGLSVGRHYVYYKIRDIKDATHFATATATVIVLPQTTTPTTETPTTSTATTTPTTTTLTAQDDTYTVTYSNEPQTVGSVYDNDRYGTATPTDKDVQFSYVRRSTDNNGKYISTVRGGMLRLPAGLSVGRHYVYYKIRDIKDATHFATATATVIVLLKTTTPTTSTSTTTPTTTTSTTITLTAQDDTYTVTYNTDPQIVGSVYDNDRYGTTTPTDKEVQFSYVRRSTDNNGKYISTARGGMLRLPAGLSVGRHYVYYKIRDIKDVTHFATATATVIVLPQTTTPSTETPTTSTSTTTPTTTTSTTITLTAQDDTYTVTYSAENQLVGSVYDNDRYGTATPTDKEVQFSYVRRSTDNNGKFISTAQGGMLRLPAGLSVGRHYVHYKIRDIKDITHFATATATVIVLPQTTTPTTKTPTTEEPLRPIAVADAVTTPMNTPVLIAILQNDIPYDAVPYISAFPYKGSVTLNDSNEVLYTPNSNTTGADSFTYELRSPDAAISLATTTVTVKIWSPITPCTGISANGDGKNDYFHIMGIENYPENTLTIYDSNANKVFSVSHYDNEVCRFEGANLPQGVYFFVLTYRDEDDNLEQQVGWFYLKK